MKNIVLAVVCIAVAVTAYVATLSFPHPAEAYRSPSIYPQIVIATIIILSLVLAATELLRRKTAAAAATVETPTSLKLPLQIVAIMAAYFALMQVVGFSVATFAFLFGTVLAFGGSVRPGLLFAAAMTAGQYVVFATLLNVRLYDPAVAFLRHAF